MQRRFASLLPLGSGGVAVKTHNLHATLVFIGKSAPEQEKAYRAVIAELDFAAMDLTFDTFGWWKMPRVLWVGAKQTPAELIVLVDLINRRLFEATGFVAEKRLFSLHITLARKHPGLAPNWGERAPLVWRADTVALMESRSTSDGVLYRPLLSCRSTR
jgi:2'-5' RNA ligase